MTVLHIQITVIPEKRKEFFQTILVLMNSTREEEGCKDCHIYQDIEYENSINIIEEWKTARDLAQHLQSDHYRVLRGAIHLLGKQSEIKLNTVYDSYSNLKIFETKFIQSIFFNK